MTTIKDISAQSNAHESDSPKVWTNSENWVNSTSLELKADSTVSSIANVESPSTEASTVKFFNILEDTQLTIRQMSSGSSQNWSIGTESACVPPSIAQGTATFPRINSAVCAAKYTFIQKHAMIELQLEFRASSSCRYEIQNQRQFDFLNKFDLVRSIQEQAAIRISVKSAEL